ncbi:hypothetical protein OG883_04095 [Streptomyces sp. NBC_01142]|uniref:hypothetical protein n=1 Tax=Streptomyces sp. NBC_01142 TaxID=2975865 RepID=UPI002253A35D|nr:hypothetical protein [Streptomyces sp. NBC_01142]MCX4819098.1 hypothetical protein [Streptomyces sp. NBC_01142]
MISEPELVGDEQPFGAPEIPGSRAGHDPAEPTAVAPEDRLPARRSLPPWAWTLGGVMVASALWAGGLYVYESREPDLGGYRVSRNLCLDAELKALSTALGERQSPRPTGREHTSLDRASCYVELQPTGGPKPKDVDENGYEGTYPSVHVSYELHKKTDPGPEFEASVGAFMISAGAEVTLERVEGLGERAYFTRDDSGDPPWLHVLDGQAEFTLTVTPGYSQVEEGQDPEADLSGIGPFMVEDMKALMAKLRS